MVLGENFVVVFLRLSVTSKTLFAMTFGAEDARSCTKETNKAEAASRERMLGMSDPRVNDSTTDKN